MNREGDSFIQDQISPQERNDALSDGAETYNPSPEKVILRSRITHFSFKQKQKEKKKKKKDHYIEGQKCVSQSNNVF